MRLPPYLGALTAFLLAACTSTPVATLPEPLPEALPWELASEPGGAFLGVHSEENDSGSLDDLFFEPGVRVTRVVESSPAEGAGIKTGDVVLSVDGADVNDPGAFDARVAERAAGDEVELTVRRGDTVHSVRVALAGRRAEEARVRALYRLDPARSLAGWATDRGGVRLVSAAARSPFLEAGIAVGSLVRAVDGRDVRSDRELVRTLSTFEPGARVAVEYADAEGAEREATVRLAKSPTRVTSFSVPVVFTYRSDPQGEDVGWVVLDLYFISLFRYARTGSEREWRFLRFFRFATGVGELAR